MPAGSPRKRPRPLGNGKIALTIELDAGMRAKIHRHAVRNERSDGAEIRSRLAESFKANKTQQQAAE